MPNNDDKLPSHPNVGRTAGYSRIPEVKIYQSLDGVIINSALDIRDPSLSQTAAPSTYVILRDSDVAHGFTSLFETDIAAVIASASGISGGLFLVGLNDSTASPISLWALQAGNNTPTIIGLIDLDASWKSGSSNTAVGDAAALFSISNNGNVRLNVMGNGALSSGLGGSTSMNRVMHAPFTAANLTTTSTADVSVTSYSLPAGALDRDGAGVKITAAALAGVTNSVFQIKFGATVVAQVTVAAGTRARLEVEVIRRATSSQRSTSFTINDTVVALGSSSPAENEANAITIDVRCDQVGAGTFTLQSATIQYLDPSTTSVG